MTTTTTSTSTKKAIKIKAPKLNREKSARFSFHLVLFHPCELVSIFFTCLGLRLNGKFVVEEDDAIKFSAPFLIP